jgi:hypothetical protein
MKRQDRNELLQKLLQLNESRELNLNIFQNAEKNSNHILFTFPAQLVKYSAFQFSCFANSC